MIYSTNRTASLGDVTIDVNESYFGAGALSFGEECAQDELAIFEAAIKSDIDEVLIGESADELTALNEGFVENAINKIKELMKKFMEWLEAVSRSAIAKMSQLVVRDNGKFCKIARKQIAKMKNQGKFEAKGTVLKAFDMDKIKSAVEDGVAKDTVSVSDVVKSLSETDATITLAVVEEHLKFLENFDSKVMGNLRKTVKEEKKAAAKVVKDAEAKLKGIKTDDEAGRNAAQKELEDAKKFKEIAQKTISTSLSVIKQMIKIARAVVAKAMGATPKNEAFGWDDEDLATAMLESMELEYDDALEEMSEACKKEGCEDCDSDDDEIEDED